MVALRGFLRFFLAHAVVEVRRAVLEQEVATLLRPEALGPLEHGGEHDDSHLHQLAVAAEAVIGQGVILQLVTGAGFSRIGVQRYGFF